MALVLPSTATAEMIAVALFGLCFILSDVAVGHSDVQICNDFECIICHQCNHLSCPPNMKPTCYPIVKRGGNGADKHNCACQPEDYCDGFYSCHNWECLDSGFLPHCNIWNHTCTCIHRTGFCSGSDVSTCQTTCNSHEKLYCNNGFCSCMALNYCNQNNADCAHYSCKTVGEAPFCNNTQCQCAFVVDTCQGSDTSTCRHLNCNGQFMHQICKNGVCQCQLNPSCSSVVDCTETNTAIEIGNITKLECKSGYGLFTDCKNGRCQCFRALSTSTTTTTTAPTTTFTVPTPTPSTTKSTTAPRTTETTTRSILTQQTSSATIGPSTPAKVQTTAQTIPTVNPNVTGCVSRSDCDYSQLFYEFMNMKIPCPVGHEDCVNNACICQPFKVTTPPPPSTSPPKTTTARTISCYQCGDPDANLPCDLRTVYMGQPSPCSTGSYCMTDVVQGSDDSVAIYKRCVDELTCRNEWMAQSSDQDRCVLYADGAVPGQYTCHYCCTVDGCNSKIVPEAKYFYSSPSSINK